MPSMQVPFCQIDRKNKRVKQGKNKPKIGFSKVIIFINSKNQMKAKQRPPSPLK